MACSPVLVNVVLNFLIYKQEVGYPERLDQE